MVETLRYKVFFTGEISEACDIKDVKRNIASLYKVDVRKVEMLFSARPVVIKNDVDYQTAIKYKSAFEKRGAICKVEPVSIHTKKKDTETVNAGIGQTTFPNRPSKPDLGIHTKGRPTTANELEGIRGWLRFFVIIRIYFYPICTVIVFIFDWIGNTMLAQEHSGVIISGLVDTAVGIYLTVRSIQVGIGLRNRKLLAVQATRNWLVSVLIWAIISPFVALILGFPSDLLFPIAIPRFISTLISTGIWYLYFDVSKRVKATYPDWAVNDLPNGVTHDRSNGVTFKY